MLDDYEVLSMPEWAMCAVFNGDRTGLDEEELKLLDDFLNRYEVVDWVTDDETGEMQEASFTWHPEFGLACNCYDCYCKPREQQEEKNA